MGRSGSSIRHVGLIQSFCCGFGCLRSGKSYSINFGWSVLLLCCELKWLAELDWLVLPVVEFYL